MKNSFLIGKRLYLRGLTEDDLAGNYVSWFNDEKVCEHNSHHVFPYTYHQAKDYIRSKKKDTNNLVLAIVLKKKNFHIGNISLQDINYVNRSAELAIIIGEKKYWGKGYAREAAQLIVAHGLKELNLHRIHCGTSATNIPMQKLAIFLGMKHEGRRKEALYKHGKFVDILEFGLLRKDFKSS